MQMFPAGMNVLFLTYAWNWWSVIGPINHSQISGPGSKSD